MQQIAIGIEEVKTSSSRALDGRDVINFYTPIFHLFCRELEIPGETMKA